MPFFDVIAAITASILACVVTRSCRPELQVRCRATHAASHERSGSAKCHCVTDFVGAFVGADVGAEVTGADVTGAVVSGCRHKVKPAYCIELSDVHVIVSPALRVMVLLSAVPPYFTPWIVK